MKKFIEYFIKHSTVTNWIMLAICAAGIFALSNLNRRINPKYERPNIEVNVPFPGASAMEVEEGITIKIEEALKGIEAIDKVYSTSSDGFASLNVQLYEGYDIDRGLQKIKNAVNSINSYPLDAEKPVVYHQTQWNRAVLLTISGPEDLLTLKSIVEEFRDDLYKTGRVSSVHYWGLPAREFSIEVSPDDLIRYKLTIEDIAHAVRNSNLNISSGSVLTDRQEILIRSYNKKYQANELENIEITSSIDGRKILLADICDVVEQFPDNQFYSEFNGTKSVGFNVMYNNDEDVVEINELTDELIEKYEAKYAGMVNFSALIRETDDLNERIDLMSQNGIIGLVLVIVMLSIFLNSRVAFWVALGIPISLLGMFFVLWTLDITINEMSLFGIIMVIGILVDDGIIIGESIFAQYERYGKRPMRAAIDGTMMVIKPVTISIASTIVAFIPYFYFYGDLGRHVWQIAAVVIIALLFSLIEAIILLPAHLAHSKAMHSTVDEISFFARIRKAIDKFLEVALYKGYDKVLRFALKHRYAVSAAVVMMILIITGMFQGQHVRAQFFPDLEPPYARIQLEMPAGISADIADKIRDKVIAKAFAFGETYVNPETGLGNPIQNYTSWMNGGTINIFFVLPSSADRDYSIGEFSDGLSEYIGQVPEAENIVVGGWSFGGSPISVKLQSHDYTQLLKAKDLMKAELRQIDGVKDIQDDTPLGNNEFIVELKEKGKALGFTMATLTRQLRQGFYGQEVMRLQRGRDEMKIWVRFKKEDRMSVAQIENLKVVTPTGEYVPFKEVATYHIERSVRRIRHEDGERSVTVFANLDNTKNDLTVVLSDLNDVVIPRVLSQVENVSRSFGGQSEEMEKIAASMQYSMLVAIFVMFTILMFLLKSYWQTLLILSLIPLGIIGAVIGHFIVGIPVSILSFLGIVALAGIIVNDSVVLVDRYNNLIAEGTDVAEALYDAATTRFRPIILTTVTTAVGLAPIIFLRSEQGQFLVPMAVSVAFGLIFGTLITLLMLPSALYVINDFRKLVNKKKSRVELEPAYKAARASLDL